MLLKLAAKMLRRRAGSAAATLVALALGVIVVVGRVVMRPLFRLVASVGMSDLFVATTLFVIVAAGVAAAVAGFSMALGAFVAGLLLAETEFRKAIETAYDYLREGKRANCVNAEFLKKPR